jgi:hypothetical protein
MSIATAVMLIVWNSGVISVGELDCELFSGCCEAVWVGDGCGCATFWSGLALGLVSVKNGTKVTVPKLKSFFES